MPRAQGCAGAAPRVTFLTRESHQSHLAPKGFALYAGPSRPRSASGGAHTACPYAGCGVGLHPSRTLLRARLRPFLGHSLAYGAASRKPTPVNRRVAERFRVGILCPYGAPATQAFGREPEGAREGSRAWTASTGTCCRDTSATKARTRGRLRAIRVAFLLVTFLWRSKEKLPAVGQPPTSGC